MYISYFINIYRNVYFIFIIFLQRVLSLINLHLFIQYETKNFLEFINDDSVKDNNEKINNNSKDKKNDNDNQDIIMIKQQNEIYKNKINELEKKIKDFELIIKEKDSKINEYNKIQEFKNVSNDNNNYINRIKELEIEIEKYKNYCLSPGEKLITIKFISTDKTINFNTFAKKSDIFTKLEAILYENYPQYKESENYFLVNGKKVKKLKTIEDNEINDNDILTLGVIEE